MSVYDPGGARPTSPSEQLPRRGGRSKRMWLLLVTLFAITHPVMAYRRNNVWPTAQTPAIRWVFPGRVRGSTKRAKGSSRSSLGSSSSTRSSSHVAPEAREQGASEGGSGDDIEHMQQRQRVDNAKEMLEETVEKVEIPPRKPSKPASPRDTRGTSGPKSAAVSAAASPTPVEALQSQRQQPQRPQPQEQQQPRSAETPAAMRLLSNILAGSTRTKPSKQRRQTESFMVKVKPFPGDSATFYSTAKKLREAEQKGSSGMAAEGHRSVAGEATTATPTLTRPIATSTPARSTAATSQRQAGNTAGTISRTSAPSPTRRTEKGRETAEEDEGPSRWVGWSPETEGWASSWWAMLRQRRRQAKQAKPVADASSSAVAQQDVANVAEEIGSVQPLNETLNAMSTTMVEQIELRSPEMTVTASVAVAWPEAQRRDVEELQSPLHAPREAVRPVSGVPVDVDEGEVATAAEEPETVEETGLVHEVLREAAKLKERRVMAAAAEEEEEVVQEETVRLKQSFDVAEDALEGEEEEEVEEQAVRFKPRRNVAEEALEEEEEEAVRFEQRLDVAEEAVEEEEEEEEEAVRFEQGLDLSEGTLEEEDEGEEEAVRFEQRLDVAEGAFEEEEEEQAVRVALDLEERSVVGEAQTAIGQRKKTVQKKVADIGMQQVEEGFAMEEEQSDDEVSIADASTASREALPEERGGLRLKSIAEEVPLEEGSEMMFDESESLIGQALREADDTEEAEEGYDEDEEDEEEGELSVEEQLEIVAEELDFAKIRWGSEEEAPQQAYDEDADGGLTEAQRVEGEEDLTVRQPVETGWENKVEAEARRLRHLAADSAATGGWQEQEEEGGLAVEDDEVRMQEEQFFDEQGEEGGLVVEDDESRMQEEQYLDEAYVDERHEADDAEVAAIFESTLPRKAPKAINRLSFPYDYGDPRGLLLATGTLLSLDNDMTDSLAGYLRSVEGAEEPVVDAEEQSVDRREVVDDGGVAVDDAFDDGSVAVDDTVGVHGEMQRQQKPQRRVIKQQQQPQRRVIKRKKEAMKVVKKKTVKKQLNVKASVAARRKQRSAEPLPEQWYEDEEAKHQAWLDEQGDLACELADMSQEDDEDVRIHRMTLALSVGTLLAATSPTGKGDKAVMKAMGHLLEVVARVAKEAPTMWKGWGPSFLLYLVLYSRVARAARLSRWLLPTTGRRR